MSEAVKQNRILAALPPDEYERIAPHLKPASFALSEVLFRPGDALSHVFFPTTCIISLLTQLEDGRGLEVGLVGREGFAGVAPVLGVDHEMKVATVQGAGEVLLLRVPVLLEEFARGGKFRELVLLYVHALTVQISQSAACTALHHIEGRLARWLLMYADRAETDELVLTHEFIANMLGIRRAGVSEIAYKLQERGLISYQRGRIRIIDRKGLEEFACACYPVVKAEYYGLQL
jgi:CRP-like cAMP-binding protein